MPARGPRPARSARCPPPAPGSPPRRACRAAEGKWGSPGTRPRLSGAASGSPGRHRGCGPAGSVCHGPLAALLRRFGGADSTANSSSVFAAATRQRSGRAEPRRCGLHGRALPCQSLGEFSLPHQLRRTGLGTERGCVGAQEPEQLVNLVDFIGNPHSWLWNLSLYACGAGATLDRGLFVLTSLPRRQQCPVW